MEHFDEWLNDVLGEAAQNRVYKAGLHSFGSLMVRDIDWLLTRLPEQDVLALVNAWVYPFDNDECVFTRSVRAYRDRVKQEREQKKANEIAGNAAILHEGGMPIPPELVDRAVEQALEEDDLRPEYDLTKLRRVMRQYCTGCKKRVPIDEFELHPTDMRYRRTVCGACFDEAVQLTEKAKQEGVYVCHPAGV